MQWLSRGKFDRLPRTTAGSTFGALDGCGLCCHLPAHPNTACLLSSSCSSARVFAPRFLQTSPLGPCASLSLHVHHVVKRTFTSKLSIMLGTQSERRSLWSAFRGRPIWV